MANVPMFPFQQPSTAAPHPSTSMFSMDFTPLHTYLAELHHTVHSQLHQVTSELRDARALIHTLEEKVQGAAVTTKATESLAMAMSAQMVTRSQFQKTMEGVKQLFRELDPTLELNGLSGAIKAAAGAGAGAGGVHSHSSHGNSLGTTLGGGGGSTLSPQRSASTFGPPSPLLRGPSSQQQQHHSHPSPLPVTATSSGTHDEVATDTQSDAGTDAAAASSPRQPLPSRSQIIRNEITAWYNEVGLREAEDRHRRTADALGRRFTTMQEALQERATMASLNASVDTVRKEVKTVRDDFNVLKKKLAAQSDEAVAVSKAMQTSLDQVQGQLSKRITTFYDILCIQEDGVLVSANNASATGAVSLEEGTVNSQQSPRGAISPIPVSSVSNKQQHPLQHHHPDLPSSSVSGQQQQQAPLSQSSGGLMPHRSSSVSISGSPASAVLSAPEDSAAHPSEAALLDLGVSDPRTIAVLHSPVFSAFRQAILNDIAERVSSSRHAQSSDLGLELLALRNDVRQRVTVPRVLELIKQYANQTEVLAKWDQMERRMAEVSKMAVHSDDFIAGLKTKVDVCAWDQKVDRVELSAKLEELHAMLGQLRTETTTSIAEAKALAHSSRLASGVSQPPAPLKLVQHSDDTDAQFLPSIVAGGDTRPPGGRHLTSSSSDRTGSRQAATSRGPHPTSHHHGAGIKSKTPIRPLTESRTQSQNVNPFSPRPPPNNNNSAADAAAAASSSYQGPGPAIPMTPNQEAYAKIVSEDQLRQMLEGLPVLPYS